MKAGDIEQRTTAQITWRFMPFLMVCYFVAYLDRVNVSFAKLTMDADIGISDTMFGFGAGVFFLAYFVFEVPSNLLLDKFGARVWIARIMFSWGLISGAMAFIPDIARITGLSGEHTFYALRILLGFAEAGFFPGIIYFLTLWFPATYRGRIVGYFMSAIPLSSAIGSPVSAWLLGLDGLAGLKGWQWLFVAEAMPSLILAFVTYFYLTDRPADAKWLDADQRNWLIEQTRRGGQGARARFARQHPREPLRPARARHVVHLFRGRRLPLRRRLLAADDRQGLRRLDRDDGLDSRDPLRRRLRRHDLVGQAFGRPHGAHDPSRHSPGDRRDRRRRVGVPRRSAAQDGRFDVRLVRRLRGPADLLDAADSDPLRRVGCSRHRGDQFDRQSLGLFRPLRDRLDQGRDRQLQPGALRPSPLVRRWRW